MQRKTLHKQYKKLGISAVRRIGFSFFAVILIGSILLSLPMSHTIHSTSSYLDHLFVATSATCVTGLVTHVTASEYTLFGQIVIILLIQIGGLGFLTLMSMFFVLLKRKLTYANKIVMQEALNRNSLNETGIYIKRVIKYTVCFELIGAICLAFVFIPQFGILKGIYYSLFHAISAFCNAGFALFSNNLEGFSSNVVVNLTVGYLITLGGIGFAVITSFIVVIRNGIDRFNLTSKMAILISIILTLGGMILFLILEYSNPNTIGDLNFFEKILASYFQSVTLRTAGFNTVPLGSLRDATIFISCILMFIGASPGSTGGGIKTTTFGVIMFYVIGIAKKKGNIEVFNRRIDWEILNRALAILVIAITYVAFIITCILVIEDFTMEQVVFEVISAFGTVGLTLGITPQLSVLSKLLIIITMFIGRLGPLTFALAIGETKKKAISKYPKENILVG